MTILIVDDIATNLKLLRAQLEAEGMAVLEAADGVEALANLERAPVDAIISDILMPRMDGYRLCHEVRKSERWQALPFIVYTATYTSASDEKLSLDLGADKFLRKPASTTAIVDALREVMSLHPTQRPEPRVTLPEVELMKEYSERLVAKLEHKNGDLSAQAEILRERERQLTTLIGNLPGLAYRCRNDQFYTMEFVSDGIDALTGYPTADFIEHRRHFGDLIHPADRDRVWADVQAAVRDRRHFELTYRITNAGGAVKWVWERGQGICDAAGQTTVLEGFVTDITARVLAHQRILHLNRVYAVLSGINETIVREKNLPAMLKTACRIAIERGGFRFAWIGLLRPPAHRLEVVAHAGAAPDTLAVLGELLDEPQRGCAFTAQALEGGGHGVCNDFAHDPQAAAWRDEAMQRGYRAMAALPLRSGDRIVGTFNLYAGETEFFNDEELRLLDELAMDIGFALEVHGREEERQRGEAALRESERRLRTVTSASNVGLWDWDLQGNTVWFSPEWKRQIGYADDEISNHFEEWQSRVHPDDLEQAVATVRAYIEKPWPNYQTEFRFRHRDGSYRWILAQASLIADAQGKPARMLGSHLDITERKQAEEVLREMNARYSRHEAALVALTRSHVLQGGDMAAALREITEVTARALDVARVSVWRYERDKRDIVCAELYERGVHRHDSGAVLKEEAFPGYFRAMATADIIAAHDAIHDPRTAEFTETYLRPLGITSMLDAPIHSKGIATGVFCCEHIGPARQWTPDEQTFAVAVANLVSLLLAQEERQKLEEQFRQSQKMEAIGQLAGGVAHDFNNILTVIRGYADLVLEEETLPADLRQPVEQMSQAADRAAGLTRQLLAFSRKQVMQTCALDLNEVVANVTQMLRRVIGEDISLRLDYSPHPLPLHADPGMLEQVLLNLAVNARDAMPRGGKLVITTVRVTVDEAWVREQTTARVGEFVCLGVRDTGCGMPPEVQARIFEPFFTTKPVGKGTGLGLATVQGIVQQHHGWVEVESEVGQGTEFKVYLPANGRKGEITAKPASAEPLRGGRETILLAEDEPALRQLARMVLERLGYRVLEATSGVDALSVWEDHGATIDLLLTDMVMPDGMSGADVAEALRARKPALKVIYTSGYSAEAASGEIELQDGVNFLPKPYAPQKLARLVRDVLDR
ncbi:MAG: response regulator [Verrucomicrobiota bacterium]